ncbi:uncharacterized protein KGF55_001101 [Candida pseudojiufengensis]|uniref:uncharacterized protein n=1 Tax=Candida pseudojiufengensis TaxID=497109 RepID=UPI0022242F79|nr:uncharacterized protein KGF55_001101 [Candida pseudojiufengensis]KAI5965738.1 hypothetical protein KGF55_001101 [Candida pseudojiufengensis]
MSYGKAAAERIENQTFLITGCSSGIGEATCLELAEANPNIKLIITARRKDKLDELKTKLEKEYPGIKVLSASLDVSDLKSIDEFFKNIPSDFADIDVLINNAGLAIGQDEFVNTEVEDAELVFQTNVLGSIAVTKKVLPLLKKKNTGTIVFIGSIAGIVPYDKGSIYCASKAAIKSFSDSLRKELISTKIRVILNSPGAVETNFSLVRFKGDKAKSDAVYDKTEPLIASDIAESLVFSITRRQNVVIAETLIFPNHQASPFHYYRKQD